MANEVASRRAETIEKIVEFDDNLLERFFAEEEIGVDELKAAYCGAPRSRVG